MGTHPIFESDFDCLTDEMFFIYVLSWISFILQLIFATLSIAAGLYYVAEIIEEFTAVTEKIIWWMIVIVSGFFAGLWILEGFPITMIGVGLFSNVVYLGLLRHFPLIELSSPNFILFSKPSNLDEASALAEKVHGFEKACVDHLKVLEAADSAAKKMTTHKEADDEVAALKERYMKVKAVADDWVAKVDTLVKEWQLLDNTVTELNTWVAKDKTSEGENQFSLEKMESTLGELKNIFKQKEKLVDGL